MGETCCIYKWYIFLNSSLSWININSLKRLWFESVLDYLFHLFLCQTRNLNVAASFKTSAWLERITIIGVEAVLNGVQMTVSGSRQHTPVRYSVISVCLSVLYVCRSCTSVCLFLCCRFKVFCIKFQASGMFNYV